MALSLSTRLYYQAKPFLPRRLRVAVRRLRARQLLRKRGDVWPINPAASAKPEDWRGWPDDKQFAFVLTHDVESIVGLRRVKELAEIEMGLGFRSSFNFVPEGEYEVPLDLLKWLVKHGFEIGVHDLRHDGRLFASRESFRKNAVRINHFLDRWGAVGFRSGFMLNELAWLHDLRIVYDASTFDTDPFEPQPEGVRSIFPFWVSNREGNTQNDLSSSPMPKGGRAGGYLELPYTLAQDFTLFCLLRDRTIDRWKTKLDWIVQCGGMALLDVHPDYASFVPGRCQWTEYPVGFYRDFLESTKQRYDGQYWHALPREVAQFCVPRASVSREGLFEKSALV